MYLDYASAAPVVPQALRAMREAEKLVGNPGAIHAEGVAAKRALEDARTHIAGVLGCKARGIVFTSGLTEANNLGILGFARGLQLQGRSMERTHWIVSSVEHACVLECFAEIERMGGTVSRVSPDSRGIIMPEAIGRALRPETVFVSVGWANNEIGTIQPLADIARVIRQHEKPTSQTCLDKSDLWKKSHIVFHSDGGQAPLYLATSAHSLGVDLLCLGSNKLYGPHGIGCVYVSDRTHLAPVILGGNQERGLRAGTENAALAAGFATAFEIIAGERESESKRLKKLRDHLARELSMCIPGMHINGDLKHVLPHMLNVSIPNVSTEYLTLALDYAGIAVSTKSACQEGEKVSHVVAALGGESWRAQNTLRFSLGRETTASDTRFAVDGLTRCLERSR